MGLAAPFQGEPTEIMKVQHRYAGLDWLATPNLGAADRVGPRPSLADHLAGRPGRSLDAPGHLRPQHQRRLRQPRHARHPGEADGQSVILQDGDSIYLSGRGASDSGDRPFLDKMDLKTLKKERLFRCGDSVYERPLGFVGNLTNADLDRSRVQDRAGQRLHGRPRVRLPQATDRQQGPAPELTGLTKELIKYRRADGVPLSGTLYLPPGYRGGTSSP